jgi:hypothetical protein
MADRTNAVVSSLFPSNVRDRIFKDAEQRAEQDMLNRRGVFGAAEIFSSRFPRQRLAGSHRHFDTKANR